MTSGLQSPERYSQTAVTKSFLEKYSGFFFLVFRLVEHPILGPRFLASPAWPLLGQVPFSDCDAGLRGGPPAAQGYVT